ncbi:Osmolarity sensor protein EnvZ [bacterium HR40]|nr:Osmolarity sensor protein EnvZ [bacterium HR40]
MMAGPRTWSVWLRRGLVPRTLLWRSMLIIVLPLVLLQVILTVIFYNRHWDTITSWLAAGVAGEVALAIELLDQAPDPETRRQVLDLFRRHTDLALSLEPGGRLQTAIATIGVATERLGHIDSKILEAFEEKLHHPFALDLRSDWPSRVVVYVQLEDGLLRVLAPRKRVTSTTTGILLAWMVGASLVLVAVAIYYMGLQIRPIRQLVRAMDSFGKGRDVGDFAPRGPLEIRKAARAFNAMRRRILQFVAQRTEMLAAISHDLRTPLTRMKLELELLGRDDDPSVRELRRDVEEMAHLVDVYLDFARGEGGEDVAEVDIAAMLRAECERTPKNGVSIELRAPRNLVVPVRPIAFRRCVRNLLDNAIRYGRRVLVTAEPRSDSFEIRIEDDGPGIPEEERERVFQPFYRADRARRSDTGGAGLGLAITRDIVLAHGGEIELGRSALGGLAVAVRLPR